MKELPARGPLTGLRIIDLSTVIAAPFASTLLADLGADVIKVELPDGRDPLRSLPPHKDGVPLWWKVTNRNKRGITLDVRTDEGRELFLRLLEEQHVLVENFRTGTLDRWGLHAATLRKRNPRLTILRLTGFGQTGPYRQRPGFARVFEAISGLTYISGPPDRAPSYSGYPIGDAVAGLFGAVGILAALMHSRDHPQAPGQDIDLAATEAMLRILDSLPVEYDQLGVVRERTGNQSGYNAPVNTYRTRDGKWLSLHAAVPGMFARLAHLMERPELLEDGRFGTPNARMEHVDALDALIAEWIGSHDIDALCAMLGDADITHCPIYSIADVFEDPQFREREALVEVKDSQLGTLRMQAPVPRFSATPGGIHRPGPNLGQDNAEVFEGLGVSSVEMERLRAMGVI